jgi:hypothetical protein
MSAGPVPACGAEMFARRIDIMGADPANAVIPAAAPPEPYEPWASPVMILAGLSPAGAPWLWLSCRACGWFAGYARQYAPAALAEAAARHEGACEALAASQTGGDARA